MSTEFSTGCGKLFGTAVEKSTGGGGVFHRSQAPLRGGSFVGNRRAKRDLAARLFFKKGLHFSLLCGIIPRYTKHLPVAQLDSASDSDSEGRRFESFRVGQKESRVSGFLFVLFTLLFSLFTLLYTSPARLPSEEIRENREKCRKFFSLWSKNKIQKRANYKKVNRKMKKSEEKSSLNRKINQGITKQTTMR